MLLLCVHAFALTQKKNSASAFIRAPGFCLGELAGFEWGVCYFSWSLHALPAFIAAYATRVVMPLGE